MQYLDVNRKEPSDDTTTHKQEITGAALITTVADKKSNYTVKKYKKALLARRTQNIRASITVRLRSLFGRPAVD